MTIRQEVFRRYIKLGTDLLNRFLVGLTCNFNISFIIRHGASSFPFGILYRIGGNDT